MSAADKVQQQSPTPEPEEAPGQAEQGLLQQQEERQNPASQVLFVLLLGGLYICVSAGLITFNKYLIHAGRFPYSVPLVSIHMLCSSVLALMLFFAVPSFFKSLSNPETRIAIDGNLYFKRLLPIALTFSASMVLSNQAYLYLSVAFLQMMKETNVVLVYTFSLFAMMEPFTWNHLKVIVLIMAASALTVQGEMHFSIVGFAVQGSGQLFECTKVVLQGILLSSAGMKLDAPSFVLLVAPVCFVVLAMCITSMATMWPDGALKVPTWSDVVTWWPFLLANGSLAFVLNIIVALFIKHTSAVAMILAGIVKDAAIVFAGVFLMGESITSQQTVGFLMQLSFISMWSSMKMFPQEFEEGIASGCANMARKVMGLPTLAQKDEVLKAANNYGSTKGDKLTKEISKSISSEPEKP